MNRVLFLFSAIPVFILIECFNWFGFILDEIFFPSYRKINVKSPKYIIGMPRSGTTYLHNLLIADKKRFTSMRLLEIIFAPSIIQKKVVLSLWKIDKKFRGRISQKLAQWEKTLFRKYKTIHPLSFFDVEEDDYILVHILSTVHLIFPFPSIKSFYSHIQFDELVAGNRKRRIMSFYKRCVQKHMYVFGGNKTYLAKSPAHTSKVRSIKKIFPDSHFIYMLRKPHEAITSTMGLLNLFCDVFFTPVDREALKHQALKLADYNYLFTFSKFNTRSNSHYITEKFEDLIVDPFFTVSRIYKHFGYGINSEYKYFLESEKEKTRSYQSGHFHSLEIFDLKLSEIKKTYNQIYKVHYDDN